MTFHTPLSRDMALQQAREAHEAACEALRRATLRRDTQAIAEHQKRAQAALNRILQVGQGRG